MRRFVPDREMLRLPLARRLIVAIIVVSSTITLCLTAFQLYGEYRSELGSIQDDFRQIEVVHLNSLVQSLWATNEPELQLQIEGIVRVPNLEYIVVREGETIWAQAGHRASRRTIERQYPLTYVHRGQTLEIGVLTVVAGLDSVYRGLINKAFIILASNALKTFLVAGFAFAFFHWLVTRHLVAIAEYVHGLDPRRRGWPLILARAAGRRPDELDDIAAAINLMHENARSLVTELQHKSEVAQLLEQLARAANEAVTPEEAMRVCLTRLCEFGNWVVGRVAMTHELSGDFERSGSSIWHAADLARYKEFIRISQDFRNFPATGRFAGVAVREQRPVWISDVNEMQEFRRKAAMLADGLRAAFGFPVVVQGKVVAFLEFFAGTPRPKEAGLIAASETIAAQLARLIESSRATEAQARLAAIVEHSSDAIVGRALDYTITSWNAAAERMLGYTAAEVIGRDPIEMFPLELQPKIAERRKLLSAGQMVPDYETVRIAKDGRHIDVEISYAAIKDHSGCVVGTSVILRDITPRIEAEKALWKNYELLDRIFATTHFCVVYLDPDFNFVRVNKAYADACGHPAEFFSGKNHFELYPGEKAEAIFRQVVATGEPFTAYANPFEFPDHPEWGTTYWDWTLHPLKSECGDVEGLLFALLDVTKRKRNEDALRSYAAQLRNLSRRLREVEESERRAISRELHDRIGQGLTTLGLMVGALDTRLSRESRNAVQKLLKDMQALIQYVVAHVRDVMAELRPPVLDDYGLLAALRQLVKDFAARTGIAVNVSGVEPYPRLPPVVETAMYRIIQEALNNIVKHARAKNVEISLNPAPERVVLDIADDGAGFDANNIADGGEHWGMITMRERAEAVGIAFRLDSAPGAGTRIVLEAERAAS